MVIVLSCGMQPKVHRTHPSSGEALDDPSDDEADWV
jgi:hypothetical protein